MPKANSIRLIKPRATDALSDEQIRELTLRVCAYGDDAKGHAEALLVLLDAIGNPVHGEMAVYTAKIAAFCRVAEEDSQLIQAEIQLLRGELL